MFTNTYTLFIDLLHGFHHFPFDIYIYLLCSIQFLRLFSFVFSLWYFISFFGGVFVILILCFVDFFLIWTSASGWTLRAFVKMPWTNGRSNSDWNGIKNRTSIVKKQTHPHLHTSTHLRAPTHTHTRVYVHVFHLSHTLPPLPCLGYHFLYGPCLVSFWILKL